MCPSVMHLLGLCFTRWRAIPAPLSTPVSVLERDNTGNSCGEERLWKQLKKHRQKTYSKLFLTITLIRTNNVTLPRRYSFEFRPIHFHIQTAAVPWCIRWYGSSMLVIFSRCWYSEKLCGRYGIRCLLKTNWFA